MKVIKNCISSQIFVLDHIGMSVEEISHFGEEGDMKRAQEVFALN